MKNTVNPRSLRFRVTLIFVAVTVVLFGSVLAANTWFLEGYYRNYHFEEEVSGNDVKFNYQLMTGSAKTRNAIKLLSVMDYDRTMISEAERMVEEFMNSGVWEEKPL